MDKLNEVKKGLKIIQGILKADPKNEAALRQRDRLEKILRKYFTKS